MADSSGARYGGDDYQILYSWYIMLDLLLIKGKPKNAHVYIEHPKIKTVDDIIFYPEDPSKQVTKYYQIKWHMDQGSSYTFEMLIDEHEGTSLLKKFWESWNKLNAGNSGPIELWLASSWLSREERNKVDVIPDGIDGGAKEAFLDKSEYAVWKQKWQTHLGLESHDERFEKFIQALRFEFKFASLSALEKEINRVMFFLHLRSDLTENDFGKILIKIRKLVEKKGKQKIITKDNLLTMIKELELTPPPEHPILFVDSWDKTSATLPYTPEFLLDVSAYFNRSTGKTPSPEEWKGPIEETLQELARKVKQQHVKSLQVRGKLPLSIAFALGTHFHRSVGCTLLIDSNQPGEHNFWDSSTVPKRHSKLQIAHESEDETSNNLCLCISVTKDTRRDARDYLAANNLTVHTYIHVSIEPFTRESIKDAAQAIYIAQKIANEVRTMREKARIKATHVFYAGPQALAVLIGQQLNAMGHFQFYEYPNPLDHYVPAYTFQ